MTAELDRNPSATWTLLALVARVPLRRRSIYACYVICSEYKRFCLDTQRWYKVIDKSITDVCFIMPPPGGLYQSASFLRAHLNASILIVTHRKFSVIDTRGERIFNFGEDESLWVSEWTTLKLTRALGLNDEHLWVKWKKFGENWSPVNVYCPYFTENNW